MKQIFVIPTISYEIDWLTSNIPKDAVVLPVHIDTLVQCRKLFPHVQSIEEFVPYAKIMNLADCSIELAMSFAQIACHGDTIDGYAIPRICWQGFEYFFRDILLAEELGSAFRKAGARQVTWVGSESRRPINYLPTDNAVIETLRFCLGNDFEVLPPPLKLPFSKQNYVSRIGSSMGYLRSRLSSIIYRPSKCQVAAVFTPREWTRYTDAFAEFAQTYPGNFQFWSMGDVQPDMLDWGKKYRVHIASIAYPHNVDSDIRAFFTNCWQDWLGRGRHAFAQMHAFPILASDDLQIHFEFAFLKLWPRIAQWARNLERNMYEAKVALVLASSDYVAAYAMPHYVSAKVRIPSVALPHTYAPRGGVTITSTFLACRNRFEQMSLSKVYPEQSQILLCSNAANALSYSPKSFGLGSSMHRKVAILVADEDLRGTLMAKIHRAAFVDTLLALFKPPIEFSDLEFVFKSHPRADLSKLLLEFKSQSDASNVLVLDSLASVTDLVQSAWLVVMCNYFGSASVQAIESGKPIVFLDSAHIYWPGAEWTALAAGTVVPDMVSFWDKLRSLKNSPEQYQDQLTRAKDFGEKYLQPVFQTLAPSFQSLKNMVVVK